jgi:hypothetical protein
MTLRRGPLEEAKQLTRIEQDNLKEMYSGRIVRKGSAII